MADQEYLDKLRHSAAHLLAAAVLDLYPDAKLAIGPSIENGFYYDIDFGETKLSEDDLGRIEDKMRELVSAWENFERNEISTEGAKSEFQNNPYKLELIDEHSADGGQLTIYRSGSFQDLCRGGHVDNPSEELKYFKLLSIAGAYWRGDEKNKMLTRIYGTAFPSQVELDTHLKMLEEAKLRDHKKLGRELDLFFIDEAIGKGLPMWTPKGTAIKLELENFTRELEKKYGYAHVYTPYLAKEDLYKISGHIPHYTESMYAPIDMDGEMFYLRPMACPHHIRMYQHQPRSYRELPLRYAEIADYNRYEQSGELMGMLRVRKFQLTDAHIFTTEEQLKEEFKNVCKLIDEGVSALGIKDKIRYRFSKRDPNDHEKYVDNDELWEKSQALMKEVLDEIGFEYYEAEGEAAFYGPKLDIQMINVNGKEDTAFTAQIDYHMPEQFNLEYIAEDGSKKRPVMIHRSAIGALERTFAFLIEHFAGAFPVWLSPTQVKILPITDSVQDYANEVGQKLKDLDFRVEIDNRSETLQAKIRDAQLEKVPYMVIIGEKEQEAQKITVRLRSGENLKDLSIDEFINKTKERIDTKSLEL